MNNLYSPHTGEHIQTDTPADWMGRAGVAVPAYTPGAESAAWNGAAWEVAAAADMSPTPAQKQAALEALIQQRLDTFARSVNFDSMASACITGMQPVGTYRQAAGAQFIQLRYTTWQKAAEIRDAYLAGTRPEPTWAEVEAELPVYPIGA